MARGATSPQLLRRTNSDAVLAALRAVDAVTVTDLMAVTGLTRATVLSVCDELILAGWVHELDNTRDAGGDYTLGRPARRFALAARAGVVVGVDLGVAKVTVVVADLRGAACARASDAVPQGWRAAPAQRLRIVDRLVLAALNDADATQDDVLAVTVGMPVPVSRSGELQVEDPFWRQVGVDAASALTDRYGWPVRMENDANLAALAEHWCGAGKGLDDIVAMLAGERLGAGVIESGTLLHGSRGGFGELGFLRLVDGVGNTDGIAMTARELAADAVRDGTRTVLRTSCGGDPDSISAEMVFEAAAGGDPVARDVLHRTAVRMARIVATLGSMTNPELFVIAGAVAPAARVMIDDLTAELARLIAAPPRVVVSDLGDLAVCLGAVRHALNHVEANVLDMASPATSD